METEAVIAGVASKAYVWLWITYPTSFASTYTKQNDCIARRVFGGFFLNKLDK